MASQRIARSLQAVARQSAHSPAVRIARTPFSSRQVAAPISSQCLAGRRWYSDAPVAEPKKGDEAAKPAADAQAEEPTKKELEAAKKEIAEAKVCYTLSRNDEDMMCAT